MVITDYHRSQIRQAWYFMKTGSCRWSTIRDYDGETLINTWHNKWSRLTLCPLGVFIDALDAEEKKEATEFFRQRNLLRFQDPPEATPRKGQ